MKKKSLSHENFCQRKIDSSDSKFTGGKTISTPSGRFWGDFCSGYDEEGSNCQHIKA
jgi:hypothetical protein